MQVIPPARERPVALKRAAALLSVVLLAACGRAPEAGAADTGRARRVVALAPSLTELVVAMGGASKLTARTDYDTDPAVLALPSVGGGLDPSMERVVALGIDLALLPEIRETPALAEQLANVGVDVLTFPIESVADIHETLGRLGRALDLEAEADSVSRAIAGQLDDVRRQVGDRPRVDVMYVVWPDPPMTTGTGTFIEELIEIAGGSNVFADASLLWPTVGFESIVERNPTVLIWPGGEAVGDDVEALRSRPGWRDVPAVQDGRVVFVDGDLFNRPGPGVVEAARTLARALHPDAF